MKFHFPANRPLHWAILTIVFIILIIIGINNGLSHTLIEEFSAMYLIDSVIFFLLYRDKPTLGLVMLILLLIINICVIGYYSLAVLVRGSA